MTRKNEVFDGQGNVISSDVAPFAVQELTEHLENYRYRKETGGITYSGNQYHTDKESRATWLALFLQASADSDFVLPVYKAINAVVTNLSASTILAIYAAGQTHINNCFIAENTVLTNIADYDTPAEIEAAFDTAYEAL